MVLSASQLQIVISAKDQASKALDAVKGKTDSLVSSIEKHSGALKKLGLAGAGVLGTLGLFAKSAEEQRKTQAALAQALDNVGVSYERNRVAIEGNIAALQKKTATSDEEQRQALVRLVTILGDYDQAMAALPAVIDASVTSGSSLATVAGTLGRALSGAANTAESVGITFDKNATFSERLALTMEKVGGAAEAAKTPSQEFAVAWGDFQDKVGDALLPMLDKITTGLTRLTEIVNNADESTVSIVASLAGIGGLAAALAAVLAIIPSVVKGLNILTTAIRALVSSTGIGLLITGLSVAVTAFGAFQLASGSAEEAVREMNAVLAESGRQAQETAISVERLAAAKRFARGEVEALALPTEGYSEYGAKMLGIVQEQTEALDALGNETETVAAQLVVFEPAIATPIESGVQRSMVALQTLSNGIGQVQQQAAAVANTGVGSSLPGFSGGVAIGNTNTPEGLAAAISKVQGTISNLTGPGATGGAFGIGQFKQTALAQAKAQLDQLLALQQSGGGASGSFSSSGGSFTPSGGGFSGGGGASIVNNGTIVVKVDNSLVELAEILGSA